MPLNGTLLVTMTAEESIAKGIVVWAPVTTDPITTRKARVFGIVILKDSGLPGQSEP